MGRCIVARCSHPITTAAGIGRVADSHGMSGAVREPITGPQADSVPSEIGQDLNSCPATLVWPGRFSALNGGHPAAQPGEPGRASGVCGLTGPPVSAG
jgi:hypothetical protein